ncbi:hypothetical protein PROFUN_16275, partial [Planoprotostelium fungivorum]
KQCHFEILDCIGDTGNIDGMFAYIEEHLEESDPMAFQYLFHNLNKIDELGQMVALFEALKENNITPTARSLETIIEASVNLQRAQDAEKYYKELIQMGFTPSETILVHMMKLSGDQSWWLDYIREQGETYGLSSSPSFKQSLADFYCLKDNYEVAWDLTDKFKTSR